MDVILIPGFWLDATSWAAVTPTLVRAGHTAHPLTLPGLEPDRLDRSVIGLQDQIDAVVAEVDRIGAPVVLVGHSGGGAVAHAVVDARPDSVRHVIYVDSGPMADGGQINPELPVRDGVVPLPEWTGFEEQELAGLDGPLRSDFRARAIDQPARVATDRQHLSDERRFDVPVTVITSTFPSEVMREMMAAGHPYMAELTRIREVTVVDLPTGHWPQFTRPDELAAEIEAALARVAS